MKAGQKRSPFPLPPRVGRLDSVRGVLQELTRIYRAGRRGEIDAQDLTRFAYVLQVISKVLEQADLETRLVAVEQALDERDGNHTHSPTQH